MARWWVVACAWALRGVARGATLDRCDACFVVYSSLQRVLALEHLDEDKTDILAGGRLDSTGKRQGKTISYATSEFRTSHLLDQVCEMASTFYPKKGQYPRLWLQNESLVEKFVSNLKGSTNEPLPTLKKAQSEAEELRMSLRTYCDDLIEEREDELAAMIKADAIDEDGRAALCREVHVSCKTDKKWDAALKRMREAAEAAEAPAADAADDADAAPKKKRRKKKKKAAAAADL